MDSWRTPVLRRGLASLFLIGSLGLAQSARADEVPKTPPTMIWADQAHLGAQIYPSKSSQAAVVIPDDLAAAFIVNTHGKTPLATTKTRCATGVFFISDDAELVIWTLASPTKLAGSKPEKVVMSVYWHGKKRRDVAASELGITLSSGHDWLEQLAIDYPHGVVEFTAANQRSYRLSGLTAAGSKAKTTLERAAPTLAKELQIAPSAWVVDGGDLQETVFLPGYQASVEQGRLKLQRVQPTTESDEEHAGGGVLLVGVVDWTLPALARRRIFFAVNSPLADSDGATGKGHLVPYFRTQESAPWQTDRGDGKTAVVMTNSYGDTRDVKIVHLNLALCRGCKLWRHKSGRLDVKNTPVDVNDFGDANSLVKTYELPRTD